MVPDKEHLQNEFDTIKEMFIDDTAEMMMQVLFDSFFSYGFYIDENEENIKQISLVFHAIKAVLYKRYDLNNKLNTNIDDIIIENEYGEFIVK